MVTREEYNKALDIVEAYHKQLFMAGVGDSLRIVGKTSLLEWDKFPLLSNRVKNIFENYNDVFYIEDLDKQTFMKLRNAGMQGWDEFKALRDIKIL